MELPRYSLCLPEAMIVVRVESALPEQRVDVWTARFPIDPGMNERTNIMGKKLVITIHFLRGVTLLYSVAQGILR